jgi:hypothetical protein
MFKDNDDPFNKVHGLEFGDVNINYAHEAFRFHFCMRILLRGRHEREGRASIVSTKASSLW